MTDFSMEAILGGKANFEVEEKTEEEQKAHRQGDEGTLLRAVDAALSNHFQPPTETRQSITSSSIHMKSSFDFRSCFQPLNPLSDGDTIGLANRLKSNSEFSMSSPSTLSPSSPSRKDFHQPLRQFQFSKTQIEAFSDSDTDETGPDGQKKKGRTTFTQEQVGEMERQFAETNYITNEVRLRLSESLGLQQHQVKTWFQNRRMKEKRQRLAIERSQMLQLHPSLYSNSYVPQMPLYPHAMPPSARPVIPHPSPLSLGSHHLPLRLPSSLGALYPSPLTSYGNFNH